MSRTRLALTTVGLALLTLTAVAFSPPVRAQIADRLVVLFAVGGQASTAIPGLVLPTPSYLPASFRDHATFNWQAGTRIDWDGKGAPPIPDSISQLFHDDERFVRLTRQTRATANPLPAGKNVDINGRSARLAAGIQGSVEWPIAPAGQPGSASGLPTPSATPHVVELRLRTVTYSNGLQLTWQDESYQYTLVSNLGEEELLKIARSIR